MTLALGGAHTVRLKTAATGLRPWIYRKMVAAAPDVPNGSLVSIEARDGAPAGIGLYNRRSQIALRVLRWGPGEATDAFLERRIRDSIYIRRHSLGLDAFTNAYRVVNSEGDDLSGLIVDRYGDAACIQIHAYAWWRRAALVESVLRRELAVDKIAVRVADKVERAEGFRAKEGPFAAPVRARFVERGLEFEVDFERGHKTGAFLDQRENRDLLSRHVAERDVLDLCCYQGGFAVAAAVRGNAGRVVAVDLDESALETARRNARANAARRVEFVHADAFAYLKSLLATKSRFDVVVLDPPKLAPSLAELPRAASRYVDLNELALKALRNHGLLLTCSCSGLVSEEMFLGFLRKAAARAERRLRILSLTGAGPDHPISPHFPEGRYLKCVLASVEGSP